MSHEGWDKGPGSKSNQVVYGSANVWEPPPVFNIVCLIGAIPAGVSDKVSNPQTIKFKMIPAGSGLRSLPVVSVLKVT